MKIVIIFRFSNRYKSFLCTPIKVYAFNIVLLRVVIIRKYTLVYVFVKSANNQLAINPRNSLYRHYN